MMSNPLEKLRKLKGRSWSEIRVRGKQTISAYSEQFGLKGDIPSDEELRELIAISDFEETNPTAKALFAKFYENGKRSFFPSFLKPESTAAVFGKLFGDKTTTDFLRDAENITDGNFDLLGFTGLDFGDPVDWHYEPLADLRSPMQHWKLFDELDSSETGDAKIIWELNRHQFFFTLGVAYLHTKDEKFAASFVKYLESWMDQNPPGMGINWSSSLEVSFRAISWVWAFHFFEGSKSFTPEIFEKALKYLFAHGTHIEQYLSTYYSPNTHLTGEALGLYYLGTQLPFLKRADHWKALGKKILLDQLDSQVLADGVYFEQTTWYHRYTTDFYLHFLILQRLSGDEDDGSRAGNLTRKVQSLLDFLMFSARPDGTTPIIGDDDGGRSLPLTNAHSNDFRGTLALGSLVFGRGDYKHVSQRVSQEAIWLLGLEAPDMFDALEGYLPQQTSKAFEDGGYFVMRDGWSDTDNYLMFDAGDVGSLSGGHGHADTLSFELVVTGNTTLVDPGTFTYHKSKALRDSFRSSNAHNTLTIDNKSSSESGSKFSWLSKAKPNLHSWLSYDRFDFVEASHDGYQRLENSPAEHSRSILFLRYDYWIMRDFVETHGKHSYQQNFHFAPDRNPQIVSGDGGADCVCDSGDDIDGLALFTFGDNGLWKRKEGWVSDCYGKREKAPFFQFSTEGSGPQEFFTFMIPRERDNATPTVFETEVSGGRAFVIKYRDYQDLFVYADGSGQLVRTEFFDTDFRFLWARLSGDKLPEEFVMIDGNHFSLDGRVVIDHPNKQQWAISRRFGSKLHVRTEKDLFSVSLPQSKSSAYVMKNPTRE